MFPCLFWEPTKYFWYVIQKSVTLLFYAFFLIPASIKRTVKEQATHFSLEVVYSVDKFYVNLNYVTKKLCAKIPIYKISNTVCRNKGKNPRQCDISISEVQFIFVQSCKILQMLNFSCLMLQIYLCRWISSHEITMKHFCIDVFLFMTL